MTIDRRVALSAVVLLSLLVSGGCLGDTTRQNGTQTPPGVDRNHTGAPHATDGPSSGPHVDRALTFNVTDPTLSAGSSRTVSVAVTDAHAVELFRATAFTPTSNATPEDNPVLGRNQFAVTPVISPVGRPRPTETQHGYRWSDLSGRTDLRFTVTAPDHPDRSNYALYLRAHRSNGTTEVARLDVTIADRDPFAYTAARCLYRDAERNVWKTPSVARSDGGWIVAREGDGRGEDTTVWKLDDDCDPRWHQRLKNVSSVSDITLYDGRVYAVTRESVDGAGDMRRVRRISRTDSEVVWSGSANRTVTSLAGSDEGIVLSGSGSGDPDAPASPWIGVPTATGHDVAYYSNYTNQIAEAVEPYHDGYLLVTSAYSVAASFPPQGPPASVMAVDSSGDMEWRRVLPENPEGVATSIEGVHTVDDRILAFVDRGYTRSLYGLDRDGRVDWQLHANRSTTLHRGENGTVQHPVAMPATLDAFTSREGYWIGGGDWGWRGWIVAGTPSGRLVRNVTGEPRSPVLDIAVDPEGTIHLIGTTKPNRSTDAIWTGRTNLSLPQNEDR